MNENKTRDFRVRNTLKIDGRVDSDGNTVLVRDSADNIVLAFDENDKLFGSLLSPRTQDLTTSGSEITAIDPNVDHVTVTSGGAGHEVQLPAPVVGKKLTVHVGANGFDLQSTAPASIAINGGTGSGYESPIAANSTLFLICVSATAWKGFFLDADSDVAKIVAAAA